MGFVSRGGALKRDVRFIRGVAAIVVAKWLVTAALLASLTLPFATCTAKVDGRVETYGVGASVNSIPAVLCLAWPVPLLLLQSLSRRFHLLKVVLAELFLSFLAIVQLILQLAGAVILTLGDARPGPGFDLASSCIGGYAALAVLHGGVIYGARFGGFRWRKRSSSRT